MATSTEDLQRQAWRELYEMLSASLEDDVAAKAGENLSGAGSVCEAR